MFSLLTRREGKLIGWRYLSHRDNNMVTSLRNSHPHSSDEYILWESAPFVRDDRGIFEYSAKQFSPGANVIPWEVRAESKPPVFCLLSGSLAAHYVKWHSCELYFCAIVLFGVLPCLWPPFLSCLSTTKTTIWRPTNARYDCLEFPHISKGDPNIIQIRPCWHQKSV